MQLGSCVRYLIFLAILANMFGMLFPSLDSTFTPYYGSIAKHIVIDRNWQDLMLLDQNWLDKPHLPFWLTALSYKLFGFNSFAYMLPGFLFHLIGLCFTYKLAKFWYDEEVALLAVLFSASALHLMLSAIDVRAEAFMLGEIMPACYFWLRYDKHGGIKYLLGGALFTALALMTKGAFTLITIISGIAALWLYRGKWRNFISPKWLFALGLSFIFIAPELWTLYAQFDLHPEKIVYDRTHVSGIRWFFWDSQFGRYLGVGPLRNDDADFSHYFFFIHTFLWSYLPWWPMFFVAAWQFIKDCARDYANQDAGVFLFTSFFVTFILFSLSTFQVDHYTNIIFPFASIICAAWLNQFIATNSGVSKAHPLFYVENIITICLLLLVLLITPWVLDGPAMWLMLSLDILAWIAMIVCRARAWEFKLITFPTIAICLVFVFAMTVNGVEYAKYDGGYQIARYLNTQKNLYVVSYNIEFKNQMDMLSLNLHSKNPYQSISNLNMLQTLPRPLYLVAELGDLATIKEKIPDARVEKIFKSCTIETFLTNILQIDVLNKNLHYYVLLRL